MDEHTDSLVRLDLHPPRSSLRGFGIALAVLCCARAWMIWRQTDSVGQPAWIALVGLIAVSVAWLRPSALRGLYVLFGVLTYPLRWLAAFTILAALYFAVITPVAWLLRLLRRSPLRSQGDRAGHSAWHSSKARGDKPDYFRQF